MDRASVFGTEGRGFESLRAGHSFCLVWPWVALNGLVWLRCGVSPSRPFVERLDRGRAELINASPPGRLINYSLFGSALNGLEWLCVALRGEDARLACLSACFFFSLRTLDRPLDSDRWSSRKFIYKCSRLGDDCKLNFLVPLSVRPNLALAFGLHLADRCLCGGKSTNFFGFGFVRVCSGVRVCFGDDAALWLMGGALRRWGWRGFVAARGSLGSSDFCGAGWLSRHFQCLATFFDPYRGREIWALFRALAVRCHPGRVSHWTGMYRVVWIGL